MVLASWIPLNFSIQWPGMFSTDFPLQICRDTCMKHYRVLYWPCLEVVCVQFAVDNNTSFESSDFIFGIIILYFCRISCISCLMLFKRIHTERIWFFSFSPFSSKCSCSVNSIEYQYSVCCASAWIYISVALQRPYTDAISLIYTVFAKAHFIRHNQRCFNDAVIFLTCYRMVVFWPHSETNFKIHS